MTKSDDKPTPEADATEAAAEAPKPAGEPIVARNLAQYIRDMSFENIVAQKGITQASAPNVGVNVSVNARKRDQADQYEVVTKFTIEADSENQKLFVMELEYAGAFLVQNVPDDRLPLFLMVEAPYQLFPFVRRIVSDVTRDAGFPSVNIEQIDWMGIFRQQMEHRAKNLSPQQANGNGKLKD